jgi:HD superfamily phosphohydrolase YqeK
MTNKEIHDFFKQYPEEMPIKLRVEEMEVVELTTENILHTSETAYVNDEAPEEEWDCEDGKIELGSGTQYLLLNPLIV